MEEKDTYKTIKVNSPETLFKEKNSKFFGYAFPVTNEDEVKQHLQSIKKTHHAARHLCYAYKIGVDNPIYRANDDGEPNNSAGQPIYGQIQSFGLTNILVVVVRYFGGVKLGVGGLISAYKTSAQTALQASEIIEKTITIPYLISFDYKHMNKVMRIVKEKQLKITEQKLEYDCKIKISVRKKMSKEVFKIFDELYEVSIRNLVD